MTTLVTIGLLAFWNDTNWVRKKEVKCSLQERTFLQLQWINYHLVATFNEARALLPENLQLKKEKQHQTHIESECKKLAEKKTW